LSCVIDNLDDTICYSNLIKFVEKKLKNTEFNLIESVAQFIYDAISDYINDEKILKRVEIIKNNLFDKNLQSIW
jgi:dihydroneopterin aldolase